jgi:FPC/CPF motif-containing protein YcgG
MTGGESSRNLAGDPSNWRTRVILGKETAPEPIPDWLLQSYASFREVLLTPGYPCHFGAEAERQGELFYTYVAQRHIEHLPVTLGEFLRQRMHKSNLVVFFEPEPAPLGHTEYRALFWQTLGYLHDHDPCPRHSDSGIDPDDPRWEFPFSGTLLFVVAISPTYSARRSRNLGRSLIMVFQPREVFYDPQTHAAISRSVRAAIRRRIARWDQLPAHPDLGVYGDPDNREWKQYFLSDDMIPEAVTCPIKMHTRGHRPTALPPRRGES